MENFRNREEKKFCRKEGSEILISELSENVKFFLTAGRGVSKFQFAKGKGKNFEYRFLQRYGENFELIRFVQ